MNLINASFARPMVPTLPTSSPERESTVCPAPDSFVRCQGRMPRESSSPLAPSGRGLSLRRNAIAQRSVAPSLDITPPADPRDADALHAAAQFVVANYARLLPRSRTSVQVGTTPSGLDGATDPRTGTVTLRPGMSASTYAGTLAHELVHSRAGFSGRVRQNLEDFAGSQEHQFLRELDEAITAHLALQQQLGREVRNDELVQRAPTTGAVEYEAGGAPFLVRRQVIGGELRTVELHLPEWSAVRDSFEKGNK